MTVNSKIEWTDATFNPWIGCTNVSPGCDHCYAEAMDKHRRWGGATHWGAGAPRLRTSAENWEHPIAWNRRTFHECLDCGRRFAPPRKDGFITCPGCSKFGGKMVDNEDDASRVKQARRRVFCASLADVFDNEVDPAWRRDLLDLIRKTPKLDWLLLTKRIGNVGSMLMPLLDDPMAPQDLRHWVGEWLGGTPPSNIWLGATVVNQEEADRDIPKLLAIPARVRFLSIEPMLGPIDLTRICKDGRNILGWNALSGDVTSDSITERRIGWVIVGGESGSQARPFDVAWARSIVEQCRAAAVPCFVKQLGARPVQDGKWFVPGFADRKGGDWSEWPSDLRVREFPQP